jgi:hypothetical protein
LTFTQSFDRPARYRRSTFLIGYDAGPRDRCRSYKAEGKASTGTVNAFPLIEWGWDRDRCAAEIAAAGLPIPIKSACFFCPAMRKTEIDDLARSHPRLARKALELEDRAKARGLRSVKGLGRRWPWPGRLIDHLVGDNKRLQMKPTNRLKTRTIMSASGQN